MSDDAPESQGMDEKPNFIDTVVTLSGNPPIVVKFGIVDEAAAREHEGVCMDAFQACLRSVLYYLDKQREGHVA